MCVKSFYLVKNGVFQEEGKHMHYSSVCCYLYGDFFCMYVGVTELLMAPGQYPGSSGTRNLHDNLSDLRAQVAANEKVYMLYVCHQSSGIPHAGCNAHFVYDS